MDFQEAFNKVLKDKGIEILENNFLFRSCLLDYVSNSYMDIDLVEAFYILNDEPLHTRLSGYSFNDAKSIIDKTINGSNNKYNNETYLKSVDPLLMLLFPDEYQKVKPQKTIYINTPKKKKRKNKANNQKTRVIDIEAWCSEVIISLSNDNKVLFKKKSKYDKSTITYTSNEVKVFINSYDKHELQIPKDDKQIINIKFGGRKLVIGKKTSEKIVAHELNIDVSTCETIIVRCDVKNVNSVQRFGKITFVGDISSLVAKNEYGKTHCRVSSDNPTLYNITSESGSIWCSVNGNGNIPSTKRLFHNLKSVNNISYINNHSVRFILKSHYGKIRLP